MKDYINQLILIALALVTLQACSTTYVPDSTKQNAIAQAKVALLKTYESRFGNGAKNVTYEFRKADYEEPEASASGLREIHFNVHIHSADAMTYENKATMAQDKNGKWTCIRGGGLMTVIGN